MRIGVLTGGGDCPGLNAVIRAIVRKGIDEYGHAIVGFRDGWRGVLDNEYEELTIESTRGILHRGGTILGTSRTNPAKDEEGPSMVRETMRSLRLDGLIAIGGEDTLGAAKRVHEEGVPVLGVPKTIDNDLDGTDVTFGFDTALHVATEAIDRLHTTAESHHRILVVEVMGRDAGWIALYSGVAGGADVILIPERPFDVDAVCAQLRRRKSRGRGFSIVVVAEGASAKDGQAVDDSRGARRVRPPAPRRDRALARERDRVEDRVRDPRDRARARAARRHAHSVGPRAGDAIRPRGNHGRERRAVGNDGRAAGDADRARVARPRRSPASERCRSRNTRASKPCSAETKTTGKFACKLAACFVHGS